MHVWKSVDMATGPTYGPLDKWQAMNHKMTFVRAGLDLADRGGIIKNKIRARYIIRTTLCAQKVGDSLKIEFIQLREEISDIWSRRIVDIYILVMSVIETHRTTSEIWIYMHFLWFVEKDDFKIRETTITKQTCLWDKNRTLHSIEVSCRSLAPLASECPFSLFLRPILLSEFRSYLAMWFSSRPSSFSFLLTSEPLRLFFDFKRMITKRSFWTQWSIFSRQNETLSRHPAISRC
jgi:hypothetical protein